MEQVLIYEDTKKLPEIFHHEDLSAMLEQIDNSPDYLKNSWGEWMRARDKALLMTIYALALRPNEACSLRFDNFNLNEGTIKIDGRNNKTKKDRFLPISKEVLPYYENYFKFDRARFWRGSPYLFPSLEREKISAGRWKHIFREKILKPLGIWEAPVNSTIPKYRSYTLRHTRATELLNKYKDIFLVANVLGHSKLNSSKVYVHKSPQYMAYMRKAINSMDGGIEC